MKTKFINILIKSDYIIIHFFFFFCSLFFSRTSLSSNLLSSFCSGFFISDSIVVEIDSRYFFPNRLNNSSIPELFRAEVKQKIAPILSAKFLAALSASH